MHYKLIQMAPIDENSFGGISQENGWKKDTSMTTPLGTVYQQSTGSKSIHFSDYRSNSEKREIVIYMKRNGATEIYIDFHGLPANNLGYGHWRLVIHKDKIQCLAKKLNNSSWTTEGARENRKNGGNLLDNNNIYLRILPYVGRGDWGFIVGKGDPYGASSGQYRAHGYR
jgi:hypothetical protein